MIIAAREKCLSHDRDWMKKGIRREKRSGMYFAVLGMVRRFRRRICVGSKKEYKL